LEKDLKQLEGLEPKTVAEEKPELKTVPEEVAEKAPEATPKKEQEKVPERAEQSKPQPPNTLTLNVKYATLPSPNVVTLRSPLSPPPKPPMLGRTRSIGAGDGKSNGALSPDNSLMRQSFPEGVLTSNKAAKTPVTPIEEAPATVSARHYEGLIEELRCPGCAGAMKAPILLCKSGHSVCEQCTRILLMCPLCKVKIDVSPMSPCSVINIISPPYFSYLVTCKYG